MKKKITVDVVGKDAHTAYISLPGHPPKGTPGGVARTLGLHDLMKDYRGPRVHLDFSDAEVLIGIEILT